MAVDENRVDWLEAESGEELKEILNESLEEHNNRGFELDYIKEIERGITDKVRLLLLFEKT